MSGGRRYGLMAVVAVVVGLGAAGFGGTAAADEGMWLLNRLPAERLEAGYGVAVTPEWVEHLQKAAVKFGRGGSASFISDRGLILTNHHVARGQLAKLSTPERNLLETGFLARTPGEELRCPDAAVMSLEEIVDVTDRVRAAAEGAATVAEAEAARRQAIAAIEQESAAETGLQSEVVSLYGGGLYHLYRYRRFTDVRVVFAPEGAAAHFGGDVDNFEFPRWCLDVTLLRVYDDEGRPYRPKEFLRASLAGPEPGEPVFVVGHPGSTRRLFTADHLRYLRDVEYPRLMHFVRTREVELSIHSNLGPDQAAAARRDLLGYQNWRKGTGAKLRELEDPAVFGRILAQEDGFRQAVNADPELRALAGDAWDRISEAITARAGIYDAYRAVEGSARSPFGGSDLFRIARNIVRLSAEGPKPNGERLPEYRESRLDDLMLFLYSPAPIDPGLEMLKVESHLGYAAEELGGNTSWCAPCWAAGDRRTGPGSWSPGALWPTWPPAAPWSRGERKRWPPPGIP